MRDDVREPRAERDVHRARVLLVDLDQVADDALDAAQFAALPRFDNRARAGHVAFHGVFKLFDRVQARLGRRDFARVLVVLGLRARQIRLRGSCELLGVFDPAARLEQLRFERVELRFAFAVAVRCAAGGDLQALRRVVRSAQLASDPLALRARVFVLDAAFRFSFRGG